MESKNILIMAGGTGGHIFPALAVAQTLQQRGHHIVWLGSKNGMEERLIPQHNITLETVVMKGIRGNGIKRKLEAPFMVLKAAYDVLKIIKKHHIQLVIGFGGFITVPGVAVRLFGIPIVIHEQNAVVGWANKFLSIFAKRILFAFPQAFPNEPRENWVSNPVRQDIATLPEPQYRFDNRQGKLNITIIGGSLGASHLNELLPQALSVLPEPQRPNITHQTGRGNLEQVQQLYAKRNINNVHCVEFIDDMTAVYRDSDILICRAGALTIAELEAAGLGALLVPLPHAVDDHQTANARSFVNAQAGLLLPQAQLNAENLAKTIANLTREHCLRWAMNARAQAMPNSAEKFANIVEQLL